MKKNTTRNLTVAAMLSAVAFILMFIEFPIPMLIPSFVKMDFSDLPALPALPRQATVFAVGNIVGSGQARAPAVETAPRPHATGNPDAR